MSETAWRGGRPSIMTTRPASPTSTSRRRPRGGLAKRTLARYDLAMGTLSHRLPPRQQRTSRRAGSTALGILLASVIACAASLTASDAHACFNVTRADVDANVKKVKSAQTALDAEDLATARTLAGQAIGFLQSVPHGLHPDGKLRDLGNKPVDPPDPSLLRRAKRIDALAQSRAAKATAADRDEAVKRFETDVIEPNPDPTVLADYAELLSRVTERKGQATMILRSLRDKDLLGSARAYAALAILEKAAGSADAEQAAREKCKTMTTKRAICDAK